MRPLSLLKLRLAAGFALVLLAAPALAADFDGSYGAPRGPEPGYGSGGYESARPYPPPPPPVPDYRRPHFSGGPDFGPPQDGPCRVFVKRRFDPDGELVLRRVRVCDERPAFGPRHGPFGFDGPPPEGSPGWRWRGPGW